MRFSLFLLSTLVSFRRKLIAYVRERESVSIVTQSKKKICFREKSQRISIS